MKTFRSRKTRHVAVAVLLCGGMFASQRVTGTHIAKADDVETLYSLKHPDADTGGPFTGDAYPVPVTTTDTGNPQRGYHDHGRGGNTFVNDPCLDPAAPNRARTVQSETEMASYGKYMVAGYNNSRGFYNNTEGLSGFAYSTNGGNRWIDGGGLPPVVPGNGDRYFGDPVLVADQSARTFRGSGGTMASQNAGEFYYASIYQLPDGTSSLSVNRGRFQTAPPQTPESASNTRCVNDPSQQGVPDTKNLPSERIVWERPSVAVPVIDPGDFLDKEWLAINQKTGELYLTYTRFSSGGSTPIEMVRSLDGGRTWIGPSVIVPNLDDTFNQATQPTITGTGRIVVTYVARQFSNGGVGPEARDTIQVSTSENDGATFDPGRVIADVNPQGEPPGYNRRRSQILNGPYIAPQADGQNVYITYFNGKTPLQASPGVFTSKFARQADIMLAASHDNGNTFTQTKVNDDPGTTSHVMPSVQVNKHGYVYVGWLDRRVDPASNELTDAYAAVSHDGGATFGTNDQVSSVSTSWRVRADARPNFGDYTSSDLLNDNQFLMIWADGRFPPPAPAPQVATPDVIFALENGLHGGN